MTNKIALIIFVALLPSFMRAATVKGKVTDGGNRPVAFATVMLVESRKAVVADKNGLYVIENVPTGKYILKTTCLGYMPKEDKICIADENTEHNISLCENSIQLKEVVVAGNTDMTTLILNKLSDVPKLKKQKKEFRATSDCRIESLGNLKDFPKPFLRILRLYSSLMGFKTMFKCMEKNQDLYVEIRSDISCKGGKLFQKSGYVKKCNYNISDAEKQAFVKKATKVVGGYYDGIYNLVRHLKKNNEKKNVGDRLAYSGSYSDGSKTIHVLKSKGYEIHVAADCWQICKMTTRYKKNKSIIDFTEAYKGLYLPFYIHNSSVYDMDEKTEWDLVDTSIFTYPDSDNT